MANDYVKQTTFFWILAGIGSILAVVFGLYISLRTELDAYKTTMFVEISEIKEEVVETKNDVKWIKTFLDERVEK